MASKGQSRRSRTRHLKKYGLTRVQYFLIAHEQKGRCGICGWKTTLCVDHDHETGQVRGLLCYSCNTKLGWLELRWDDIMGYIKEAKSNGN